MVPAQCQRLTEHRQSTHGPPHGQPSPQSIESAGSHAAGRRKTSGATAELWMQMTRTTQSDAAAEKMRRRL